MDQGWPEASDVGSALSVGQAALFGGERGLWAVINYIHGQNRCHENNKNASLNATNVDEVTDIDLDIECRFRRGNIIK